MGTCSASGDQLAAMVFVQPTFRERRRDGLACPRAQLDRHLEAPAHDWKVAGVARLDRIRDIPVRSEAQLRAKFTLHDTSCTSGDTD
jgi:hypothetical protein